MSSVQSVVASPSHGSRFFVSVSATADCFKADGTAASPATVAAGVVVRDMGKTIRTPVNPGPLSSSAVVPANLQVVLRKVARVQVNATTLASGGVAPAAGFVGFVQSAEDATNSWYTFYINLYGGEWAAVSV